MQNNGLMTAAFGQPARASAATSFEEKPDVSAFCFRAAGIAAALLAPLATLGAPVAPFDVAFGSACEQIRQRLGNPSQRPPPPGSVSRFTQVFDVSDPETFYPDARAIQIECVKGAFTRVSIKVNRDGPGDERLKRTLSALSGKYGQQIVLRDSTADVNLGDAILHVYVAPDWFGLFYIRTTAGD